MIQLFLPRSDPIFEHLADFKCDVVIIGGDRGGGGVSYFPYDVLTICKAIGKDLASGFGTDYAHYVKIHISTVLRRNKNMAVECGTVSHYYIW